LLGRFPALAGVDLDVPEGEVVLLAGGNGAGKTTLLRVLAGLLPLHSGEANVLGHDLVADRRRHRRQLSLVGHETGCYDDLTVRENVTFATRAVGASMRDAEAALDRLGLGPLADVRHGRLSAGQRRRLALAVGLARAPRLLLLDEPHAGLDADGRDALDEVLRRSRTEDRTILFASHELDRVRALADREVTLVSGRCASVTSASRAPVP